jgi:NAD(P)-dependent dehydrogenase (short-subunit alcohol dehydrogenase family)
LADLAQLGARLSLAGRVALVTGASKGIGRAIAASFAQAGARVMLSSRKAAALEAAAVAIRGEVAFCAANAGDPEQARACVDETLARFGRLDILVNNAAANPYHGPMLEIDVPRWDKTLAVNLRGPFLFAQCAWRGWMREHGGVVINVASTGAIQGDPDLGVYNTSKAGLIHLTRMLAAELGPRVRVNALVPGLVKTDFSRALWEGREQAEAARLPLGRLGAPEDVAHAALFLASDLSSWITGQTLVVDGGALVARRRSSPT